MRDFLFLFLSRLCIRDACWIKFNVRPIGRAPERGLQGEHLTRARVLGTRRQITLHILSNASRSLTICLLSCLGCNAIYVVKHSEQIKNLLENFFCKGPERFSVLLNKILVGGFANR